MPEKSIRFAVRNKKAHRAATWKLVTRTGRGKNDVYLLCRSLGGALKASLHESGRWHVGFLRGFVDENFEDGHPKHNDPYIEKWPQPSATEPGVTLAYRVLVPSSGVRIPITDDLPASIGWIPAAPKGKATEILIILTRKGTKVTDWPTPTGMGTELVGQMDLDNGDTAWVVHHVVDVPDLRLPSGTPSWFKGCSREDLSGGNLRAVLFGNADDGSRFMVDCAVETSDAAT
ncbi:MAG: hypothetical protein RL885_14600 [Planctomycetota bacterium]